MAKKDLATATCNFEKCYPAFTDLYYQMLSEDSPSGNPFDEWGPFSFNYTDDPLFDHQLFDQELGVAIKGSWFLTRDDYYNSWLMTLPVAPCDGSENELPAAMNSEFEQIRWDGLEIAYTRTLFGNRHLQKEQTLELTFAKGRTAKKKQNRHRKTVQQRARRKKKK
jgi:hypothetical protein